MRDLLALQGRVARTISGEVGITLTPQEEARLAARAIDPEMHLQVMLGRHHLAKANEEGLRRAVQYFEAAITSDQENALAHAGLAEAYSALNGFYMDPLEAMPGPSVPPKPPCVWTTRWPTPTRRSGTSISCTTGMDRLQKGSFFARWISIRRWQSCA